MTVVSYLKLSQDVGMGCADERVSWSGRTSDVSTKIHRVKGNLPYFIGTSGSVSSSMDLRDVFYSAVGNDDSYGTAVNKLRGAYEQIRVRRMREGHLAKFNLSWDDFHKPGALDPSSRDTLFKAMSADAGFSLAALFGGYDTVSRSFRLAAVGSPGVIYEDPQFHSTGSGSDRATLVVTDALAAMEPHERENIPLDKGARLLMTATRSAWRNEGVGGRTQLVWLEQDNYKELAPANSMLLNSVLYCGERNALPDEYVDGVFRAVVKDATASEAILPDVMKQLGGNKLAELLFLRGLHM